LGMRPVHKKPIKKRKVDELRSGENPRLGDKAQNRRLTSGISNQTEEQVDDSKPKATKKKRKKRKSHKLIEHNYPVPPRVIQICKVPKTHVNHSYKDMSCVPPEDDYESPTDLNSMSFAEKLHHMLSDPECSDIIAWLPHGRAFRILVPKFLEEKVLQKNFGHKRYSTFLTQLQHHGLKQFTQGNDMNAFYHESMLRGMPHLCKYMPEYREGRKLIPSPSNEPDLATISLLWPITAERYSHLISNSSNSDNSQSRSPTASLNEKASSGAGSSGEGSDDGERKVPAEANTITTQYIESIASSMSQAQQLKKPAPVRPAASPVLNQVIQALRQPTPQLQQPQPPPPQPRMAPINAALLASIASQLQQPQATSSVDQLASILQQAQGPPQQQPQLNELSLFLNQLQQPQLQQAQPLQNAATLPGQYAAPTSNTTQQQQAISILAQLLNLTNNNT